MKKFILIAFLLITQNCFSSETIDYKTEYKGLIVGQSTIHEMLEIFGKPIKITTFNKNIHYQFKDHKITAYMHTGRIHAISIFDKNYVDINGMKIGFSRMALEASLDKKISKNYFTDQESGVIYWLKNNQIKKIVFPDKILRNNSN